MTNSFYPKISSMGNITGHIQSGMEGMGIKPMSPSMNINSIDETQTSSFKNVMSGIANNLNTSMNAPDQLLKDAMSGNDNVDIHDVMTAMAKAEINVNIATQVTTKVIQAYDKIMQISV